MTPTDPLWVENAASDLDRLLADHAHCELKAAQSALSMVARFGGEAPEIVEPLVALAKEETGHFAKVRDQLDGRGAKMSLPSRDDYVIALRRRAREDHGEHPVLLDRLLINALIEGRSCERFRLLSEHLEDPALRAFYAELMASEARHYRLFCRLAEERFGEERARERLTELAAREADVSDRLPLGATVHG
ncbi:MAG: tRNA-(ms[2]io[6]A)-hydroxylase [Sandaracinaceae bacterium]